jgi:hypothetical protein
MAQIMVRGTVHTVDIVLRERGPEKCQRYKAGVQFREFHS